MVKKEQKRKPLLLVYSMSNLASAKENILARNYETEGTAEITIVPEGRDH